MGNKTQKTKILAKEKIAVYTTPQPQPQESNNKKLELLKTVQENLVAQSKSLSTVTRTIVGIVLGTIWAICYKEKHVEIPNIWILSSIIISALFLIVELSHYFCDTRFYHNKSNEIVENGENFNYEEIYQEVQRNSKRSYCFLKTKAILTFILVIIFATGIGCLYH